MLSEKLFESLIADGFEAKKIDIYNHRVSMKSAEWTIEAVMNFMASSVLVITKGWSGKEKSLFDTELRKNFMKARKTAEEADMGTWVAVARKQSLVGSRACGDVG
jgi:hypothetical protein